MAKGNILKEAIADAKAVREVALQNAKTALEEAFTPKLQSMLNAKLQEDLDEDYYEDGDDDRELDLGEMDMYDEDEGGEETSMDEEIDLEEILNELELEEDKEADDEEVVSEEKEDDDEEVDLEEIHKPHYEATDVQKVTHNAEDMYENKEFDLDSLLKEINNLEPTPGQRRNRPMANFSSKGSKLKRRSSSMSSFQKLNHKNRVNRSIPSKMKHTKMGKRPTTMRRSMMENNGCGNIQKELNETKKAFNKIQGELNEVNVLNSKLLYVNRIFKANHLDDAQKLRVVETLDKAGSVKEAKLIYETIKDTFKVANTKKASSKKQTRTIKENFRGMASKSAGMSRTKKTAPKRAIISETDNMVNRFQKLANIKINE
jgi:hypothetical protein